MKYKTKQNNLLNYYLEKLQRKGLITNEFELNNEKEYWRKIKKHDHIFVKIGNPIFSDYICIGCHLSSLFSHYCDDRSILMREHFNYAKETQNFAILNTNIYSFEELQELELLYEEFKMDSKYDTIFRINKYLQGRQKKLTLK